MKVRTMIIFAGLVGALTAPVLAQTTDTSTKMQPTTESPNNPAKPYVDVPGTNKAGNDSTGATGSVGGNTNAGGANGAGGTGAAGNAPGGNAGNGNGTGAGGGAGGGNQ